MTRCAVVGATVVDASGERRVDVGFDDETGLITEIAEQLSPEVAIDAHGLYLIPGLVDLHVHFRQPGNERAETILSGSRCAARGGFTAVITMPNTDPCTDSTSVVNDVLALASGALCEIQPSAAITLGRQGKELAPMSELVGLGVRMFTDDGTGLQDANLMRRALEYGSSLIDSASGEIVLSQHCEVSALSQGGVMHEGYWSSKLGLGGQPAEAEELMVARDIALSRLTGARVHLQHLSTAGSVELVRQAKARGIAVSAEATPHHFSLTDAMCASYDPVYKVHPPLRSAADVEAIRAGLSDGTIDAIATDHAPHSAETKEKPFDYAPPGMLGLETAFALANTNLGLPLSELVRLMSTRPAEIGAVADRHGGVISVGRQANLAVVDLDYSWVIDRADSASLSNNNPFHGMKVNGSVRHTIYRGERVLSEGQLMR